MAKKSLKKRIDNLADALGGTKKPTFVEIRNELFSIGTLVEALEDGQALAEKEATIAALEAEKENLKVELQTTNAELEAFRAERKKQEEEERHKDLPELQFKILTLIPSEHGGERPTVGIVADTIGIPIYEAEIHLDRLREAKLIIHDHTGHITPVFYRTIKGNELILAKRLADEEGDDEIPYKYASLPKIEESMLAMMIGEDEGVNEELIHIRLEDAGEDISLERVKYILKKSLKVKGFADFDDEEATYGGGAYLVHHGSGDRILCRAKQTVE